MSSDESPSPPMAARVPAAAGPPALPLVPPAEPAALPPADDGSVFGDWGPEEIVRAVGLPEPSPPPSEASVTSDHSTTPENSPPSSEDEGDEEEEEKKAPPAAPAFRAPQRARHRLPKFDWAHNPFRVRIHALCMSHTVNYHSRPTHTEATLKCLMDRGLGPSPLTPDGRSLMVSNTTDFRTYVKETVPRTVTSSVVVVQNV